MEQQGGLVSEQHRYNVRVQFYISRDRSTYRLSYAGGQSTTGLRMRCACHATCWTTPTQMVLTRTELQIDRSGEKMRLAIQPNPHCGCSLSWLGESAYALFALLLELGVCYCHVGSMLLACLDWEFSVECEVDAPEQHSQ